MGVLKTASSPVSTLPLPIRCVGVTRRRFLSFRINWRRRKTSGDGEDLVDPCPGCVSSKISSRSTVSLQRCRSNLQSLFCYDKSIPEEMIEKPVGLSLEERDIGDNPPCVACKSKGVTLCATCSGCGLYVDSILESQGVIVKVRCLGCGGTGNIMCSECGGRGHV